MKITFDPKHNVAYIRLKDATAQVDTIRVSEELNVDLAPDGTVYGIELLNANRQLAGDHAGQLIVVDESSGQTSTLPLSVRQGN